MSSISQERWSSCLEIEATETTYHEMHGQDRQLERIYYRADALIQVQSATICHSRLSAIKSKYSVMATADRHTSLQAGLFVLPFCLLLLCSATLLRRTLFPHSSSLHLPIPNSRCTEYPLCESAMPTLGDSLS